MEYKVKIVTRYRGANEVSYTIPAEEAHKAYYLFLHPEQRGIFQNGLALKGEDVERIVPDYNATMGWNPTHILDDDDFNELRSKALDKKINRILIKAKKVAQLESPKINIPLSLAVKDLPPETLIDKQVKMIADKMSLNK